MLVTGGSGFVGRHLVGKLLEKYPHCEVRTISRDENNIRRMLTDYDADRLIPVIGDIRDVSSLNHALRDVDTVVHLSAMKHIDFCQEYPVEAITINIEGTRNLLELFRGDTFIGMSTDKAVHATSCYGATKLLTEKLVLNWATKNDQARYMIVRSGNVFGATGSVVEKWRQQIKRNNEITITDPGITRFFIHVDILTDFIVDVLETGKNGGVYIPPQRAILLSDLAGAIVGLYGGEKTRTRIIGKKQGEKMHEVLFDEGEQIISQLADRISENCPRLTSEEITDWLRTRED